MKIYKKILLFLISLLMIIMCGCGQERTAPDNLTESIEYEVFELGGYDAVDGGDHTVEYSFGDYLEGWGDDPDAPKEASVMFNGKIYSGEYNGTGYAGQVSCYLVDEYEGEEAYFRLHKKTRELVYINCNYKLEEEATVDQDYCRQMAEEIAKEYIDIEKYDLEETVRPLSKSNYLFGHVYSIKLNGMKTSDRLWIGIDGNGKITSFGMWTVNSFVDIEIPEIDEAKVITAIESKLNKIYSGVEGWSYTVDDVMLVQLDNGEIGYIYNIVNEFETVRDGCVDIGGSMLQFLVKEKVNLINAGE